MRPLACFVNIVDKISLIIGKIVSYFMVLVMISTVIEIVSRYFFDRPTIWAYEFGQFLFGGYFLLAGAITLYYREHVGMDIIVSRLSARGQAVLSACTYIFAVLFLGVLVYKGGQFAYKSVIYLERSTSVWGPPIWPLKAALPVAGLLMLLQATSNFVKDIYFAVTGKSWEEKEVAAQ
ncbi:MAG: TRAP transporter small permease subunit [Deltaproteobacteria bacterium]|nr:TRAP transporter small permease subunit [Deltaproteobacteria bacterium]